jgi:hypothetical protein
MNDPLEGDYDSDSEGVQELERALIEAMHEGYQEADGEDEILNSQPQSGKVKQILEQVRRVACELRVLNLRMKTQKAVEDAADEEAAALDLLPDADEDDSDTTVMRKNALLWEQVCNRLDPGLIVKGWVTDPVNHLKGAIHTNKVYQRAYEYVMTHYRRRYLAYLKRRVRKRREKKADGAKEQP